MNKNKLTAALKKKALGAAIAVAISTPAFADVTMFGIVDVGVGNDAGDVDFRVDGGEGKTIELPSIWGIKGSEDLGGGLTASFALESDLDASTGGTNRGGSTLSDNGARFWARQANISLSNDIGSLTLGRIYSPALLAIAGVDPRSFYESQSGLVQYATIASTNNTNTHVDVFLANSVQVSFNPGPLKVAVAYGAGETSESSQNSNTHIGVTYATDDLTVMANYIQNKGNNANDSLGESQKQAFGAKYTMGDIKLAGYYIQGESTDVLGAETEQKGYSLGATFTSGSNEFDIAYYNTEVEDATDAETDNIILAYRNNLSERTTLYAKLCSADIGNAGPAGACGGDQGQNDTYYGVGVFHKF